MLPMKTPPNMLNPPKLSIVRGALAGLKTLTLQEMGERILTMPDDNKALELLWEIDHLIWLKATVWPNAAELCEHIEVERAKDRWVPEDPDAVRWALLDRYRVVNMDHEVREWLEAM